MRPGAGSLVEITARTVEHARSDDVADAGARPLEPMAAREVRPGKPAPRLLDGPRPLIPPDGSPRKDLVVRTLEAQIASRGEAVFYELSRVGEPCGTGIQ